MTTSRTVTTKAWSHVTAHDLVQLGDDLYSVVNLGKVKDGRMKVTVRLSTGGPEYTRKMTAKHGVEVVELVRTKVKKWKPADAIEETLATELGAVLVGVKPSKDEVYVVPLVDASTISAHLFMFHGREGVPTNDADEVAAAVALHDADHAGLLDDLHEPHVHQADRPHVTTGPRFR